MHGYSQREQLKQPIGEGMLSTKGLGVSATMMREIDNQRATRNTSFGQDITNATIQAREDERVDV